MVDKFYNYFTFHYVSIKTLIVPLPIVDGVYFTFHYVSIKTMIERGIKQKELALHSTMSLLKPNSSYTASGSFTTLHSTMSLLKRQLAMRSIHTGISLHSTMSLLKRGICNEKCNYIVLYIPLCLY